MRPMRSHAGFLPNLRMHHGERVDKTLLPKHARAWLGHLGVALSENDGELEL